MAWGTIASTLAGYQLACLKLGMFQFVWLACAIGAAQGRSWPGGLATMVLVALHVASAPHGGARA